MTNSKITIDGIEYATADLPEVAKNNLASMQLVDQKIAENQKSSPFYRQPATLMQML